MSDNPEYNRLYYQANKKRIAEMKARRTKHDLDYRLRAILRTIIQRCEDSRHTSYPWYGARGIKNFLTLDDLKYLWERDGAANMLKPSIDRAHRDDHYQRSKCKFIELADNVRRGVEYRESKKFLGIPAQKVTHG